MSPQRTWEEARELLDASRGVPPLAERQRAGLSGTLAGPVAPDRCRSCGIDAATMERRGYPLERHIECDEWDQHTPASPIVVLCHPCARRLIEPHPRLYVPLSSDKPWPGCMPICADCCHRDGVRCAHPMAKANGGTGVLLNFGGKRPTAVHYCFSTRHGRSGRWDQIYPPVLACRQKETT